MTPPHPRGSAQQRRVAPTKASWVMWDIALSEAIAGPELGKAVTTDRNSA